MLLPHGYEGQGPEHSNAYLERYLMAGAEDNMQVCNLTTPAQLFHALRRQIKANFRRPLIIMAPKSLLRHKQAVSPVADLVTGSFQEILDDPLVPDNPRRLVLCSGKVFYDLLAGREERGIDDVAIVRVEQFYPFNTELFERVVAPYRRRRRHRVGAGGDPKPGRLGLHDAAIAGASFRINPSAMWDAKPSASPATGSTAIHKEQQAELVREALAD